MSAKLPKSKKIGKHYFQLIGKPQLYFKEEILVNFTPHRKANNIRDRSIRPTFNHDQKYYTTAFHLPFQQYSQQQDQQQMKAEHEKRVAQSTLQISEPLLAKPRSKSKYCGVCRGYYEDYLDHIQSQMHIENAKRSHYQFAIDKCCKNFYQKNKINLMIDEKLLSPTQQQNLKSLNDIDDTNNIEKN